MEQLFQENNKTQNSQVISLLFHLVTISITCSIIFYLVNKVIHSPEPLEKRFLIESVTPAMLNKANNSPVIVKTGFVINSFRQFDVLNNKFECEGTMLV